MAQERRLRGVRAPLLLLLPLLVAGCAAPDAPEEPPPLPGSMAALGDSITRATNANPSGDRPEHSWATGANASDGVDSHYERLRAREPGIRNQAHNLARSGATVQALRAQAEEAVRLRVDYVVVQVGANDACAASLDAMTPEDAFRDRLRSALDALERLPDGAVVYLTSIPDVTGVWEAYRDDETARGVWRSFGVCPVALSDAATDADREAVRERIRAYNDALREEAEARGFRHDGGAVFEAEFDEEAISALDFFHPSLHGQARLAERTWAAGPYADR